MQRKAAAEHAARRTVCLQNTLDQLLMQMEQPACWVNPNGELLQMNSALQVLLEGDAAQTSALPETIQHAFDTALQVIAQDEAAEEPLLLAGPFAWGGLQIAAFTMIPLFHVRPHLEKCALLFSLQNKTAPAVSLLQGGRG